MIYEYRSKIDTIFRFIDECYEKTDNRQDRVRKSEFEAKYQKWCVENDYNALNKRNIKERVEKNGIDCVKVHGIFFYVGLKEKEFFEIDKNECEEEQIPIEFM